MVALRCGFINLRSLAMGVTGIRTNLLIVYNASILR